MRTSLPSETSSTIGSVSCNDLPLSGVRVIEFTHMVMTRDGGKVTLIVHDRIVGGLALDLSGRAGANGVAGSPGAKGGTGAKGDNAASGMVDCQRGAGRGGTGGAGTRGGTGNDGTDGGAGGTLVLIGAVPSALSRSIAFTSNGGAAGKGGAGGAGGPGGDGGSGGDPRGWCQVVGQPAPRASPGRPANRARMASRGSAVKSFSEFWTPGRHCHDA